MEKLPVQAEQVGNSQNDQIDKEMVHQQINEDL